MSTRTKTPATIEDLYNVPEDGKAEIVNGELVLMSPTGGVPGRASGEIFVSLSHGEHYAVANAIATSQLKTSDGA